MNNQSIAIIALTATGESLARRIISQIGYAELHGLDRRTSSPDVPFSDTMAHVRGLFQSGRTIIGVCAAGILIRAVASELISKHKEPAVIAVAEDGSSVVPLLGGHHGANKLARDIASALDGAAAITTAGDIGIGFALDDPPAGWKVGNTAPAKSIAAALLSGAPVRVDIDENTPKPDRLNVPTTEDADAPCIRITEKTVEAEDNTLILYPQTLAVGIGC